MENLISAVAPGNSAALQILKGDPKRCAVVVQNAGAQTVYFGTDSTVTSSTGFALAAGRSRAIGFGESGLWAIAASGTGDLRLWEFLDGDGPSGLGGQSFTTSETQVNTGGISNSAANTTVPMSDGSNMVPGNVLIYLLTTAITANSTTTATAAGTLAVTSNATGRGTIFQSDGAHWQLLANYSDESLGGSLGTIATTGNTDKYVVAPFAGTFTGVDFSSTAALATDNTNFVTFTITNLGQAGAGSNPLLSALDSNTTKTTGGSAIAAHTKRSLVINATGSNLIVAKGDRLRIRAAASGTLANTVTDSELRLTFNRLS